MNELATTDELEPDLPDSGTIKKKKLSGKKIVLFIVLPLLLIGGAGAGVMFSGVLDLAKVGNGAGSEVGAGSKQARAVKTVFYELPEMVVNLNSHGRRPNYLKLKVSLEMTSDKDVARLDSLRPRIIDNFQVYLRELRVDDLRGSAGIYRLREELLARVNTAIHPAKVVDVLFKEILVQ